MVTITMHVNNTKDYRSGKIFALDRFARSTVKTVFHCWTSDISNSNTIKNTFSNLRVLFNVKG